MAVGIDEGRGQQRPGKVKRVFPGGNTSRGFHSFYAHIIGPEARRALIIKGGPGVGKSTFMRRIAEEMVRRGFDVELHHCSSDNGSLDAVVIPAAGVALIDGTAPHVVDPRFPGAVDEILHLGDYWDEKALRSHRAEIMALNREASAGFQRAYRMLQAAKSILDDWKAITAEAMRYGFANRVAAALLSELFPGPGPAAGSLASQPPSSAAAAAARPDVWPEPGRIRHLFASAITPDGPVHHLETILGPWPRRIILTGAPGTGKSTLLKKVAQAAVERGLFVEAYHCAFDPDRYEHLVIPALAIAFTTATPPHVWRDPAGDSRWIPMDEGLDAGMLARRRDVIAFAQEEFNRLFDRAVQALAQAKQAHDALEAYYVPHMDFAAMDDLREKTLRRILAYAAE